ncbi:MAG: hypothetical protein IPP47_00380 [Bryobacterales bacterium]|nr:hypothetical protein [Bryobacterales bacterium]
MKNQVMLGNPVFPFANRIFPNPVIQPAFEDVISRQMRNYGSVSLAEIPLESTVNGLRLTGVVGPIFLLAPLGLLALRRREGRQVLLAALVFGLPYFANIGTRFLLPCLPFLSLALAMALAQPLWLGCAVVLAHAVLSYPPVLSRYVHPGAWRIEGAEWAAALRLKPEPQYLQQTLAEYEMSLEINKTVPREQHIFSLSGFRSSTSSRRSFSPANRRKPPPTATRSSRPYSPSYAPRIATPPHSRRSPSTPFASARASRPPPSRGMSPSCVPSTMAASYPRDPRAPARIVQHLGGARGLRQQPGDKMDGRRGWRYRSVSRSGFRGDITLDGVWLDGPPRPAVWSSDQRPWPRWCVARHPIKISERQFAACHE